MYYKIITDSSFFYDTYHESMDVFNIPTGTIFTAPDKSKYEPNDPKCLIDGTSFHFSEGAFDTMLWHAKLSHHDTAKLQIYSIQPLSDVQKERCKDSNGIYQCAANKIKILEKQDINVMFDLAIKEHETDQNQYTNFEISIKSWQRHQSTCFFLFKDYRDICRND